MEASHYRGLCAAVCTPFDQRSRVNLEPVALMVDWLIRREVKGLYVCGCTGEGLSLTTAERKTVAESYVRAAAARIPVIVHVGHESLEESRALAMHAQQIGASAIAAAAPAAACLGGVNTVAEVIKSIASAAPDLPFYYCHLPTQNGDGVKALSLLQIASDLIPNLAGIKFYATELDEFQECVEFEGRRFDILWGREEMLLPALAVGAKAAVGSTYNIASPLFARIFEAMQRNDLAGASELQLQAIQMIRMIRNFPSLPAMKKILNRFGFNYGDCRLPLKPLSDDQSQELKRRIDALPFLG